MLMTTDELTMFAEQLYSNAAAAAQETADNDVTRQTMVANGLIEKPTYTLWAALPEDVRALWVETARTLGTI